MTAFFAAQLEGKVLFCWQRRIVNKVNLKLSMLHKQKVDYMLLCTEASTRGGGGGYHYEVQLIRQKKASFLSVGK